MKTQDQEIIINGQELETQPGLRAYLYQQLNELSPFMLPDSKAGALIKVSDKQVYRVTLFIQTGDGQLEAAGRSEDVYEAARNAKTLLLDQMSAIHDFIVSTRERDLEITEALRPHHLH
jgi:ribosome-associated translation inhibitor RaiA